MAVKQSVYVLPDTPESREDFEWVKVEIEGAGGEAIVYSADHVDPAAEAALIEQFREVRQHAYTELAGDLQRMDRPRASHQHPSGRRRDLVDGRALEALLREENPGLLGDLVTYGAAGDVAERDVDRHAGFRCGTNSIITAVMTAAPAQIANSSR